jgi:hypothetical protein
MWDRKNGTGPARGPLHHHFLEPLPDIAAVKPMHSGAEDTTERLPLQIIDEHFVQKADRISGRAVNIHRHVVRAPSPPVGPTPPGH